MALKLDQLRVLVVDDYAPMRRLMREVLHQVGIEDVIEARDGSSAMEALDGAEVDAILTDVRMDPMNGIELIRRIRRGDHGVNPFLPVIVVSGFTERETIVAARDAGATEFLAKPISAKLVSLRLKAAFLHPRPFVRSEDFFGPDRRRREIDTGRDRREGDYHYEGRTRGRPRIE